MTPLAIAILFLQMQAASVEGLVTKPGGGEPLAGARVTLLPATAGKGLPPISVTSEDDGSFTIQNVAPGDYLLWAESVRYGIALYGQHRAGGPGTRVSVASGQRVTGIRISMIPTGAIAGRITLRNGEPAVQAIVQALELRYQDGKRILTPVKTTTTDDVGEYRLFGLSLLTARFIQVLSTHKLVWSCEAAAGRQAQDRRATDIRRSQFRDFEGSARHLNPGASMLHKFAGLLECGRR